jgi:HK97 family phage major capsid protein
MSEEIQKTNELLAALRKSHEEGNISLRNELNAKLDVQEAKSASLTKELAVEKKAREEFETEAKAREASLLRPDFNSKSEEGKLEKAAYENFFIKGANRLNETEMKYLRTDSNVDGGYLVPVEQSSEIIKKITEYSDIRAFAKVRTLNAKTLRLSTRSSLLTGGWAGEGETGLTSNSTYGREELVAKKLTVSSAITVEELQDATPNMIREIYSDVLEAFQELEGLAFVSGDGSKKPEGFMYNTDITSINSGDASLLTFDSLIKVTGQLKKGYNPIYGFNRRTLADIRTMKDGAGAYIWQAGNLAAGVPNSLAGTSYAIFEDMPDIGAGLYPVIYGDFYKGYLIGDRAGLSVVRDEVTLKKEGKVEFTFMKRLDAQVVLPEAFKKIKCSV